MILQIEIPDSFSNIVTAKTEAELSLLLQTALLQPTLQGAVKGLQVDSLLMLEYLSKCLKSIEAQHVVVQPTPVQANTAYAQSAATIDISSIDVGDLTASADIDVEEDDEGFSGLLDFMVGGGGD